MAKELGKSWPDAAACERDTRASHQPVYVPNGWGQMTPVYPFVAARGFFNRCLEAKGYTRAD